MATLVLIHGAWHGGWCWRKLTPHLEASGHDVYTATLTGLGERSHLARPEVNLDTHVRDSLNLIEFEELNDVILVGHSYGGIVTGIVTTHIPERIAGSVYVDALLPVDGQSSWQTYRALGAGDYIAEAETWAQSSPDNWLLPQPDSSFGVTDSADAAWIRRRLTPQPVATFTQPVKLPQPFDGRRPRRFIFCTPEQPGVVVNFAKQVRADPTWSYCEIEACHDVMVSEPAQLAQIVDQFAAEQQQSQ